MAVSVVWRYSIVKLEVPYPVDILIVTDLVSVKVVKRIREIGSREGLLSPVMKFAFPIVDESVKFQTSILGVPLK